jgi:hypothetical protein
VTLYVFWFKQTLNCHRLQTIPLHSSVLHHRSSDEQSVEWVKNCLYSLVQINVVILIKFTKLHVINIQLHADSKTVLQLWIMSDRALMGLKEGLIVSDLYDVLGSERSIILKHFVNSQCNILDLVELLWIRQWNFRFYKILTIPHPEEKLSTFQKDTATCSEFVSFNFPPFSVNLHSELHGAGIECVVSCCACVIVWVCGCYDTINWTAISVSAIPVTLHALSSTGCTALQLYVQDRMYQVRNPVPASVYSGFYTYIKVTHKRHHLIHISSLILHLK